MRLVWVCYKFKQLVIRKQVPSLRKILILNLTGIGDTVCLTPFIDTFRLSYPKLEIWGCFQKNIILLQKEFIELDGYIHYSKILFTLGQIKSEKFDLIIIPGWALKHTILGLLSGAKLLGYLNDLSFTNSYINIYKTESVGLNIKAFSQDMQTTHLVERPNAILSSLMLTPVKKEIVLNTSKIARENYVVMHIGADYEGRRWSVENFSKLTDLLINKYKMQQVLLIGGNQDNGLNQQIQKRFSNDIKNLAGQLTLLETKKLIEKAKLFIGNDSGPMHIAAFSGTPTIGIMGPNLPEISGPIGRNTRAIYKKQFCSPCNQRGCQHNYICIKDISVDDVDKEISELICYEKN